ncbi:MAG: rod shape-determining protein MreD [Acidimicrobiales bacterium]
MRPVWMGRIRLAAILLLALLLQTTVVPDLRVLGVCPDLMLLCTVCAGLVGGPELGGVVGFGAGLIIDLFLTTTPLGLSALAFSIVGYGVGSLRRTVLQEGWLLAPAAALVGSSAGVLIFVMAGVMVGQSQLTSVGWPYIGKTALLVGLMNAIIATPVCRVVAWAATGARRGMASNELSAGAARRGSALGSYAGPTFGGGGHSRGSGGGGSAGASGGRSRARSRASRLAP